CLKFIEGSKAALRTQKTQQCDGHGLTIQVAVIARDPGFGLWAGGAHRRVYADVGHGAVHVSADVRDRDIHTVTRRLYAAGETLVDGGIAQRAAPLLAVHYPAS